MTGLNVSGDATHARAARRMVHDGDNAPRMRDDEIVSTTEVVSMFEVHTILAEMSRLHSQEVVTHIFGMISSTIRVSAAKRVVL